MSLIPNVGTALRLADGRQAWVAWIAENGRYGYVMFSDSHTEAITWDDFGEVLIEPPPGFVFTGRLR
jgi:hypothetical protein